MFGSEPKDYEIYDYLLAHWHTLRFSPSITDDFSQTRRQNPKRLQRQIKKELSKSGIGTKAQQALKLQQESAKAMQKKRRKEKNEAQKQLQFRLRQQKKKEKHKGR